MHPLATPMETADDYYYNIYIDIYMLLQIFVIIIHIYITIIIIYYYDYIDEQGNFKTIPR